MMQLILLVAIVLESFRMVIVGNEIYKIAKSKGVSPARWVVPTILMWIGIEVSIVLSTALWLGFLYVLSSFFIAILIATVAYRYLKSRLKNLPDKDWEKKIEEIGSGKSV